MRRKPGGEERCHFPYDGASGAACAVGRQDGGGLGDGEVLVVDGEVENGGFGVDEA